MEREDKYSLAESNTISVLVSILSTASFWDTIIGIRIDSEAEKGLELRSGIKNDNGCDIV